VLDPSFGLKRRIRQDRFGGLRRRNSFHRSRKMLTKRFNTMKSHQLGHLPEKPSKEALEYFGGIQRAKSYSESKKLFQDPLQGIDVHKKASQPRSPRRQKKESAPKDRSPRLPKRNDGLSKRNDGTVQKRPGFDYARPKVERRPITRSKSDSSWSYNLTRSRLRRETTGLKLHEAFGTFEQGSMESEEPSEISKLHDTACKVFHGASGTDPGRLTQAAHEQSPDLTKARKKLQRMHSRKTTSNVTKVVRSVRSDCSAGRGH
jgi:hypothetical protein